MTKPNFISDKAIFLPLWERAIANVRTMAETPSSGLLYFDSVDISTQKFLDLIRVLLASEGASDFASLVLKPDPFSYSNFHFHRYPGFVHRADQSDDDFFEAWVTDPVDSPADCFWANSEQYGEPPQNSNAIPTIPTN